jgi:Xaa-Pro aminopeptidase
MRMPLENMQAFKERRNKLAELIPGSALIISSPEETIRNGSVHFSFRQDTNLYYLTGFEEPETIFVFRPGQNPESVLFVRKKDLTRETWDGFRFGPEAAQAQFKMDAVYPVEEFSSKIVELLKPVEKVYFRRLKNRTFDAMMDQAFMDLKVSLGRTGFGLLPVLDADEIIGEIRVKKTDFDLQNHRQACQISAEAHVDVMKYIKPGMSEREIHGYFVYQIMKRGAAREGYGTIVAGGASACTLHYVFNDQILRKEDLLLIDAGAEYNYFTGDITRTYNIGGTFSSAQAEVYQGVLDIQKDLIKMVKPGLPFQQLHDEGSSRLVDLMLSLGLLTGRKEDIIKAQEHKKYYPHGIGHFLGMDVHDAGMYFDRKNHNPRKIEAGMVFTIEPGLYIPANDNSVAEKYRGIGVRIEDNILVTTNGYDVLTKDCPKEVSDLQSIVGSK